MKRDDQTRFELYTAWSRVETAFHSASSLPLVGNRMGNTGTSSKRGLQAMRHYNQRRLEATGPCQPASLTLPRSRTCLNRHLRWPQSATLYVPLSRAAMSASSSTSPYGVTSDLHPNQSIMIETTQVPFRSPLKPTGLQWGII